MTKLSRLFAVKNFRGILIACSILNYFLVIVFTSIHIGNTLVHDEGGVIGMTAFFVGPFASVPLAVITDAYLNKCYKMGKNVICSIGVLVQILLTAISIMLIIQIILI